MTWPQIERRAREDAVGWALSAAFTLVEQNPDLVSRFYPAFIALATQAPDYHLQAIRQRMVAVEANMQDSFHRETMRLLIRMIPEK